MKTDHIDNLYNYIENNIDTILQNSSLKDSLSPTNNKCTKRLLKTSDEKDAYIMSYFMMCITLTSFMEFQNKKTEL